MQTTIQRLAGAVCTSIFENDQVPVTGDCLRELEALANNGVSRTRVQDLRNVRELLSKGFGGRVELDYDPFLHLNSYLIEILAFEIEDCIASIYFHFCDPCFVSIHDLLTYYVRCNGVFLCLYPFQVISSILVLIWLQEILFNIKQITSWRQLYLDVLRRYHPFLPGKM